MLCPKCKTELMISFARMELTGDDSPDTETKVYTVQSLACRNPQCADFGKTVLENWVELK